MTYLSSITISRNPSDYSLCLVGSGCDFQNAIFFIVFLIGNFRSSPGSAFTWISQDLTHDKTTLLQLMGWFHQWQQAITPDITWTNVDPNLCRYMALLVGWVNLSHFKDAYPQSVNTLRPRKNGRQIQDDMFTWIFSNDISFSIKISLVFLPKSPIDNHQNHRWPNLVPRICATRSQSVNPLWPSDALRRRQHVV